MLITSLRNLLKLGYLFVIAVANRPQITWMSEAPIYLKDTYIWCQRILSSSLQSSHWYGCGRRWTEHLPWAHLREGRKHVPSWASQDEVPSLYHLSGTLSPPTKVIDDCQSPCKRGKTIRALAASRQILRQSRLRHPVKVTLHIEAAHA